ncbi:MAG: ABC transporter permease, partial [Gemmatimonadales bacterium]
GLQQGSRRTIAGQRLTRGALVIAEVALALVLLVGAGLLLRSLQRLFAVAVGFDSSGLLTMQVGGAGRPSDSDTARYRFFLQALAEVRRVPGVTDAAFTSQLPLSGDLAGYGVRFEVDHDNTETYNGLLYAVAPEYFRVMRIPLVHGRLLDARDLGDAPRAVLINESFARRKFPDQDAVGRRLKVGPDDGKWYAIVGVVGDVTQASLAAGAADAVYVTPTQWHWVENVMSFVIRTRTDPATLATAARSAIWSVDRHQPIVRVATMDALLSRSEAERRFALLLFEVFALVSLLLAGAGIFGVLSGSVTERMREIGVRSALGASRSSILALVLRQGMTLLALGMAIGIGGAVVASRALVTLMFGVSPLDPVTYASVIVLLAAVAAIACWIPAWRAARVDPVLTLRAE